MAWTAYAPYAEGAIMQLASRLPDALVAPRLVAAGPVGAAFLGSDCVARRMPPRIRTGLERAAGRQGLTQGRVTITLATTSIRMVLGATERLPATTSAVMYREQQRFARASARLNLGSNCIALPNAALEIFKMGLSKRVLHMVNGHPLEHNSALRSLGLKDSHQELVPQHVIKRVEQELRLADLILCPSQVVAAGLIRNGVSASKIAMAPYGVDNLRFAASLDRTRRARQVLFIGQISFRKGVHLLMEVARSLSLETFAIAGPVVSPEILRDLPENVRYLGRLSRDSVADAMASSRVVAIPSLEDAYPLVAVEALAAGARLVISDAAGTVDLLGDSAGCHIVTAGSVDGLRNGIVEALDAPHPVSVPRPYDWAEYSRIVMELLEDF